MGCLYDIYIEFLAYTVLQIHIIFALLYNKNVLDYVVKKEFLILNIKSHSIIYAIRAKPHQIQ